MKLIWLQIAQDIDKFSNCLADLYSIVSKPVLDISIYAYKLAEAVGGTSFFSSSLVLSSLELSDTQVYAP